MKYQSREPLVIKFKKILLDKQVSQREATEKLNITPQASTKILNKQNFCFDDMQKYNSREVQYGYIKALQRRA